jgi:hypothetical protein
MFQSQLSTAALIAVMATSAVSAEGIATLQSGAATIHSVAASVTPFAGTLPATPAMGCTAPTASLVEIRALLGTPCSLALCLAESARSQAIHTAQCTPMDATN